MSRSGWIEGGAIAVAAALAMTAASTLAPGAQLDDKTCAQLKLEIGQLEGLGARDNLAKGAAWGKANLRGNSLEQVKKLIEMDETVQFRCPRPKPVAAPLDPATGKARAPGKAIAKVLPKMPAAQPGQATRPAADAGGPQAPPRPKPKPKPQTAAAPAQPADAASPPAQPAAPQAKPRPRPAQPKAPDAASAPAQQ